MSRLMKIGPLLGPFFSFAFLWGCASREAYRPYLEEARTTVSTLAREAPAARMSAELREAEGLFREAEAAWKEGELSKAKEFSLRAIERAKAGRLRAEVLVEVERVAALAKEAFQKAELAESRIARIEAKVAQIESLAREAQEKASALAALKVEKPPVELKPPHFTRYIVKKGDTFWKIAGLLEIYGNHLAWPVIYEANRGTIGKKGRLQPGQVLLIPRDLPEEQMMKAIREAITQIKAGKDTISGSRPFLKR